MMDRAGRKPPDSLSQLWRSIRTRWSRGTDKEGDIPFHTVDHTASDPGSVHLPVPVTPAQEIAVLTATDGTHLVAGLTWEATTAPETPVLRMGTPPVLRVGNRRTVLSTPDANAAPHGALLLAMASNLHRTVPDAAGPWIFVAEIPKPDAASVFWLALADLEAPDEDEVLPLVVPRPGPEALFASADAALAALDAHIKTTELTGVAVFAAQDTYLSADLSRIASGIPHHAVEPCATDGVPRFMPPRQVPVRMIGGVTAATGLLLTALLVVVPLIEALLRAPPPPPPEMVSARIAQGGFAQACTGGLDAWWPRIVGWREDGAGCALAGYLPEKPILPVPQAQDATAQPMVIWRHLVPETGRNRTLALDAARQVLATWPHEAQTTPHSLTLWQIVPLPLVPVPDASADRRAETGTLRTRLATLWADAPDAVTDAGGVFTIAIPRSETTKAVFARAAQAPEIAPVRLAPGKLVVAPVRMRKLPAALFAPAADPADLSDEGTSP